MGIASIFMSITALIAWHYLDAVAQTTPLLILSLITVGFLAIITYSAILLLLQSPELALILNRLQETLIHIKRNKFS